jgi:hypothetical protein
MKRLSTGVAAVVLAASVSAGTMAGCSETDEALNQLGKAQYIVELRALVKQVQAESQVAAKLLSVDSLGEAVPLIKDVVETFDEIVVRLEEIDPPDEIAAVHNRLTEAMRSASNLLTDAQQAIETNDLASLLLLAPQLSDFRERFRGIIADYDSEGYQLITLKPEDAGSGSQ